MGTGVNNKQEGGGRSKTIGYDNANKLWPLCSEIDPG